MKFNLLVCLFISALILSCSENRQTDTGSQTQSRTKVFDEHLQKSFTPQQMLDSMKKWNEGFVRGEVTVHDYSQQIVKTSEGQYPGAVILSCVDSRVPVEAVFDLGIGDVFVTRVAGNIANTDIVASLEFACNVMGSKLIIVLGHSNCGAIKAAIDDVKLGNITELLAKIKPAVDSLSSFPGAKTSKNSEYVQKVCDENVMLTMDKIRSDSKILKEMESSGQIKIAGGIYDLNNGKVTFF